MNWIIRSIKKVKFHTNLQEILKPVWKNITAYNWILTDLDFMPDGTIPINFDHDFFILNHGQFERIYNSNTQIIWGIIAAVPSATEPDSMYISQLSAEDPDVWKSNHFSIQESVLEIIAFDSSYTIVKFKDKTFLIGLRTIFRSRQ
ncbi:hypothetical protein [Chryseobacterium sp. 2987]|uniref:hypothetical protein n=1 Tax=Chryseobacterium sp. 2987 TaxID=2817767 RepID=UPI00285C43AC|nr:hypothetical protein [Chryseobacterium sp. 2987]MDR6919448.1 hypothetical protein [Chryseobacterium sp. 2987]